jgi:hypothetical protein
VIALRVWVLRVGKRNAQYVFHEVAVLEGSGTQLSPILPLASIDHIVDCRQVKSNTVIQMPMQHGWAFGKFLTHSLDEHRKHITTNKINRRAHASRL